MKRVLLFMVFAMCSIAIQAQITVNTKDVTINLDTAGNANITAQNVDDGSTSEPCIPGMDYIGAQFTVKLASTNDQLTYSGGGISLSGNGEVVQLIAANSIDSKVRDGDQVYLQTIATRFGEPTGRNIFYRESIGDVIWEFNGSTFNDDRMRLIISQPGLQNGELIDFRNNFNLRFQINNQHISYGASGGFLTSTVTNYEVDLISGDLGTNDPCAIASLSLDQTSFDCSNVGVNTVTLTVTDTQGNTNSATAQVIVEDNIAPVLTCAPAVTDLTNDANGMNINYDLPTIQDNCVNGGTTVSGEEFIAPQGTTFLGARNGSMYFLSDTSGTTVNNYATAIALGHHLVVINDQEENDFLVNLLTGTTSTVQIGLDDLITEGVFEWQDGTALTYTNWNAGEPNNSSAGGEDYTQLILSGANAGLWNDTTGAASMNYLLEVNANNFKQPANTTLIGVFEGHTYFVSNSTVLPSVAFTTTATNGYSLVSIDDAEENAFITSKIGAYSSGVLLGINDVETEGIFVNQDGSTPAYTNWNSGEPNNFGTGEDYAVIFTNGLWNDIGDSLINYIIEIPTTFVQTAGLASGEQFPIGTTTNTFTFYDNGGNVATCSTDVTVNLDNTAPVLTAVSITSDNTNSAFAKAGDTITLTFTADEDLQATPVVTIVGQSATVFQGSDAQNWTATYMVPSIATLDQTALPDGSVSFTVDFADLLGNNATQVTTTTDASAINIDRTIPTLTVVGIASDNSDSAFAKAGDTITLTFTSNEDLAIPAVTIAGQTATVQQGADAQNWTATYLVPDIATLDQTALPDGGITFSIQHADALGNTATTNATTNSSTVTLLRSNTNAVAQDITVALDANGNATITPQDINDGSTDGAGNLITDLSLDLTSFDCSDVTQSNLADNLVVDLTNANNYINAGSNSSLRMSSQLSIALWVNASSSGGALNTIAHKEGEYTLAQWFDGSLRYGVANSSPGWSHVNSGYILPTNEWVHIVFTYVSGAPKIYVNGELVHTGTGTGNIGDADFSRNDLRFGWRQDNFQSSFNGYLDEISVWNRALTSSEIENLVNSSLNGNENGLQLYYPINTTNNTVDDLGPNNLDGTLFNTVSTPKIIDNSLRGGIGTEIILTASDAAGNSDTATAFVRILDNIAPVITLNGNATQTIAQGSTYTDPGATAADNCGVDTNGVVVGGDIVDTATLGTYTITYNATDVNGNAAVELTRTVAVEDQAAPVLMLSLSSDNGFDSAFAKAGDLITLSLISNEDLQATPVVTIAGQIVTVTQGVDAQNWTATYTVPDVATLDQTILPDGVVLITVAYSDIVGNTGSLSNTTDGTAVQIKRTAPDASTQDITVALDANGNASITPQDVSNAAASSCLEGMSYGGAVVKVQGSTGTQMGNSSSTFVTGTSNGFPVAFVPAPASRQASTLYDGIKVRAGDIVVLRVDSSSPGRVGASPSFNIASGRFVWGGYSPNGNFANRPELQIQQAGKSAGDIIDFSSPFNLRLRANGNYMRSGSTWTSSSTPQDLTVALQTGDLGTTDPCADSFSTLDQTDFDCSDVGFQPAAISVEQLQSSFGAGSSSHWQSFTATNTGFLETVQIRHSYPSTTNATTMFVELYAGEGLSGNLIALADNTQIVDSQSGNQFYSYNFSNALLEKDQKYTWRIYYTTSQDIGWTNFSLSNPYPGGRADDFSGSLDKDYVFRVVTKDFGSKQVTLTATDALGNSGNTTAQVTVVDNLVPLITLNGNTTVTIAQGSTYTDLGATATDNCDVDVNGVVVGGDTVDTSTFGTYTITYNAQDTSGNTATEVTRTVVVGFRDYIYANGSWTPNDPSDAVNPSGNNDNIIVNDDVSLTGTVMCNNLNVQNGAVLSLTTGTTMTIVNVAQIQNLNAPEATLIANGQVSGTTWDFLNTDLGTLELANADLTITGDLNVTSAIMNDDAISASTLDVTGANLTFVSNANSTAIVDGSQIDIIGEVTVEQYYQNRRAFRFISSPVNMTSTIFDNLQQGGLNSGDSGYESGYGTHITGAGAAANGFDITTTNNPSLFGWDNVNQNWVERTSTNQSQDMLMAGEYHRLLVRGDRGIDLTSNLSSSFTTLEFKGTLLNTSYNVNSIPANEDEFMIVGNPYQSQLNLNSYMQDSFNGISTDINAVKPLFYFVWDPMINTRGGYRTYSLQLDDFVGGSSPMTDFVPGTLQPGQSAFFVASGTSGGAFQIARDSNAVVPSSPITIVSIAQASLNLNLFESGQLNSGAGALDAVLIRFDSNSNNDVDSFDAVKFNNLDENISRDHVSGSQLVIENRAMPLDAEIFLLNINNYRYTQYTLQANPVGLVGMHAYIKDNFTGSLVQISNSQVTNYSFTVDLNNALSVDTNRFEIVFQNTTLSNQETATIENQVRVYPNPVSSGTFYIDFGNIQGSTSVKMYNALGQLIHNVESNESDTMAVDSKDLAAGMYLLEITFSGNSTITKRVVIE